MGSRGPGHISRLCRVGRPTVGVVTAVAAAHTEAFGGLDEIAAAKGELVEALPPRGSAVLNADDQRVLAMAERTDAEVITYSCASPPHRRALVVAEEISLDEALRPAFRVRSPWGRADVRLEARGAHQVGNALAALAVAATCGVEVEAAAAVWRRPACRRGAWRSNAVGLARRSSTMPTTPTSASMAAALDALAGLPGEAPGGWCSG